MSEKAAPRAVMSRLIGIGLIVAAVFGGAYLYSHLTATIHRGRDGRWQGITIASRDARIDPTQGGLLPAGGSRAAIRVATFNLDGLDKTKLANLQTNGVLVPLLSKFDIVALQGVQSRDRGVLSRLVEQINATGRQFAIATEQNALDPSSAFLFDQSSVEIDHSLVAPVEDPQGRFTHRPLVAWFRVRGPEANETFTFKLVNVYIDPGRTAIELNLLDDVFRAVRNDGSHEDDVIMLGSFATDTYRTDQFGQILDVICAIGDEPTGVDGGRPVDNILLDRVATCEYAGRAEVLDLMREFELTSSAARQVSSHLPVWAEFHSLEGAALDRVASSGSP